ncbi:Putative S-adenosyl-L-methionine-dependent methyltransferase superfamily [Colletotrichum destructivum]|uniref:S-adenosyl-L-methionine-dependent methyltransferase superfamily n=1 Tax=Colletotrichum destructivum TaxID=34406 RepID=A0AAX4IXJ5_9PEZI|nr:Putative S-adenosyl-L-methionine-dependent methyltransferase superfamily [Colletotrichum destructivum]
MKICVVQTSYEGSNSPVEKLDPFCDPGRYISTAVHQFEHRFIRKSSFKEDIDRICEDETYEMYFSCLWGGPRDNVAGQDAAAYLESKGVEVLTNTASAMRLCNDKLEFYAKVEPAGIRVPGNESGCFPKIVKLRDGANSETLDFDSICHDERQLKKRVTLVKTLKPDAECLVQDYIVGSEVNVVVVEMGHAVVALEPVEYVFPPDTPTGRAFLTFENKFANVGKGVVRTRIVIDEPRRSRIRETSQNAFKAAGMQGGSGWCRVDMRIDAKTGEIYVLEINAFPTVFYPRGAFTSDKVIERTYPGGHAALFDMLLATKLIQTKAYCQAHRTVSTFFDDFSKKYEIAWEMPSIKTVRNVMAVDFDWAGSVLDLACGSGFLGNALFDAGWTSSVVVGVDISPEMAASERTRKYYKQPIHLEPIEEFIMTADPFDHIACFNGLQYLSPVLFTAVLSRMFMLARKSVSFEVDDMPREHVQSTNERIGSSAIYNNTQTMARFPTPPDWKRVLEKKQFLFRSPNTSVDVQGTFYRFEKIEDCLCVNSYDNKAFNSSCNGFL